MKFVLVDIDDLGVTIMAAMSFALGFQQREDVDPENAEALRESIRGVQRDANIDFEWGD